MKAVRNIDTHAPAITSRTSRVSQFEDQEGTAALQAEDEKVSAHRSSHSKSTDSKQRVTVSMRKRLVPMDILTDARAVQGDTILTDRS